MVKCGSGNLGQVWEGGITCVASSNVNCTGKHRNSLPVLIRAPFQTSFSIINWAVLPSVKTNVFALLCQVLLFSLFITSHKKDKLAGGKKGKIHHSCSPKEKEGRRTRESLDCLCFPKVWVDFSRLPRLAVL